MALFTSKDGGRTWTTIRITSTSGLGYAIALDPKDSRHIYVGGKQGGKAALFRTDNAGASWLGITGSIKGIITELALDPKTSQTIYAGTPNGLYRSKNGGQAWERKAKFDVRVIKVDPNSPDRLWAGGENGLYQSDDGGSTWTPLSGLTIPKINCLEFDARKSILYAGTDGGGLAGIDVPPATNPGVRGR
ncbi:MAG: hypothetical protein MUQ00_01895 [Candidatus Aminicenantes bacterium]|nr:hypothetical protein [Candidatus Aminicenantes bacterium]